ncbi:MAG: hypothetical protein WDZ41_05345 [Candidatus Babeliales bacterium]
MLKKLPILVLPFLFCIQFFRADDNKSICPYELKVGQNYFPTAGSKSWEIKEIIGLKENYPQITFSCSQTIIPLFLKKEKNFILKHNHIDQSCNSELTSESPSIKRLTSLGKLSVFGLIAVSFYGLFKWFGRA